jgi:16S rRNA (guanine1516-N2)-methyltransferase
MIGYQLILTPDHLTLQKTGDKKSKPFYIDFLAGKMRYRCQQASLKKELLAKALGASPRDALLIVDATAGIGRDSFILATLGFEITLIERSPIIHALLDDAINRAKLNPATEAAANRLHLIHTDAIIWLQQASNKPDIVYLDPMFPEKQKTAATKKEMVILQDLLGKDLDADLLFQTALTCGARRIVVKRPRLAENIANHKPNYSLLGKSSRFDVYLNVK